MDAETQRRQPFVNYEAVTPGYFEAAGIPVLNGRGVSASDDETAPKAVVVSAATAQRFWPGESPIGKRLKWGPPSSQEPWVEVVGPSLRALSRRRVESLTSTCRTGDSWRLNHLLVRAAGDPRALTASLRSALAGLTRKRAVQVATVGDLAAALRQPRFQMRSSPRSPCSSCCWARSGSSAWCRSRQRGERASSEFGWRLEPRAVT